MAKIGRKRVSGLALTAEMLRSKVHYDPLTGVFTRISTGVRLLGVDAFGYLKFQVDGTSIKGMPAAWLYVHGVMPGCHLGAVNGDVDDLRFTNIARKKGLPLVRATENGYFRLFEIEREKLRAEKAKTSS